MRRRDARRRVGDAPPAAVADDGADDATAPPDDAEEAPPPPPSPPPPPPHSPQPYFDDFVVGSISRVVLPVTLCMLLSILLRHLASAPNPPPRCPGREQRRARQLGAASSAAALGQADLGQLFDTLSVAEGALFVGCFLAAVVGATFCLRALYVRRRTRCITGWLLLSMVWTFLFTGGHVLLRVLRSSALRCAPLPPRVDGLSVAFAVWNFGVGGVVSLFYASSRLVNQAYLIAVSVLTAYVMNNMLGASHAGETTMLWLLMALVVWDLYAVLSPHGPLRRIVELSREREERLPALAYDCNPSRFMGGGAAPRSPTSSPTAAATTTTERGGGGGGETAAQTREEETVADVESGALADEKAALIVTLPAVDDGDAETAAPTPKPPPPRRAAPHYVQLGLGDFIFYSILVLRSALHGTIAVVFSGVAILFGLTVTLVLVLRARIALPALPVSLTLGIAFHLLVVAFVVPFVAHLRENALFT